jgi:uncharacterized protein YggT (Ycf19 family)
MALLAQTANFALAALMWTIIGRAALGLLTGGRANPVQALFDRVTLPLFALTRRALPFVGERWAPLAALLVLGALRLGLVLLAHPAAGR